MGWIEKIIISVFKALYQQLSTSIVLTFLFMYCYLHAQKSSWKSVIKEWINEFKKSKDFQITTFFVFYVFMILLRTLLCRELWVNPVSNVIGTWGFLDQDGNIYTDGINNIILFVPFTFLLFCKKQISGKILTVVALSAKYAFVFSVCIELVQVFFKLGSFQLSDIFYNTIGGVIGGIIYAIIKCKNRE